MAERSIDIYGAAKPAEPGMSAAEICTPALVVDLDAFERNLDRLKRFAEAQGIALRPHAKTHKSADVALAQIERGGACGVCCQKLGEAEALAAGGVGDILIANEVTDPAKIERLAMLAAVVRLAVCVDDATVVETLSAAVTRAEAELDVLVEIDVGARRCGVAPGAPAAALAQVVGAAPGLRFAGLQAYQGAAQHLREPAERAEAIDAVAGKVRQTIAALAALGLDCPTVTGAGTGTFPLEAASGVFTELQCGSYVFMDADYARNRTAPDAPEAMFEQSLFVLSGVMSVAGAGRAVCDAGHKAAAIDSGLPDIPDRPDLAFIGASDEHGVIQDPQNSLALNDRVRLRPSHCDPTVNLHDWIVGVRGDRVETVWPVSARGRGF